MPRRRCAARQREVAALLRTEPELSGRIVEMLALDERVRELARRRRTRMHIEARVADQVERGHPRFERRLRRAAWQALLLPGEPYATDETAIDRARARDGIELRERIVLAHLICVVVLVERRAVVREE